MKYHYAGDCTNSTYEDISELRDSAAPVTWRTFRKHIPEARDFLEEVGAIWGDTTSEQIEGSGFLAFFKGIHRGRPAYFIDWSGYEWIWEEASQNPGDMTQKAQQNEICYELDRLSTDVSWKTFKERVPDALDAFRELGVLREDSEPFNESDSYYTSGRVTRFKKGFYLEFKNGVRFKKPVYFITIDALYGAESRVYWVWTGSEWIRTTRS